MLQHILFLLLIVFLSAIVYFDYKDRRVHIVFYIGVAIISSLLSYRADTLLINFVYNGFYVFILFSTLLIYFKYIKKDNEPFWDNKIGYGDLAMLLAISPLFHILAFLFLTNIAFVYSLIMHKLRSNSIDIPLAGDISIVVIACMIFEICNIKAFNNMNDLNHFLYQLYQIL